MAAHEGVEPEGVVIGEARSENYGGVDKGGPEEGVGAGNKGEDAEWVGMEGNAVVGEPAEELGDEETAVVEAEMEYDSVDGPEVAGAGGGVDGGDEEGVECGKGEEG